MRSYSASTSLRQLVCDTYLTFSRAVRILIRVLQLLGVLFVLPNSSRMDETEKSVFKAVANRILADPIARGTVEATAANNGKNYLAPFSHCQLTR